MRNYIILNGTSSNSITGLLIQALAPISKPLIRTEIEEIDGRDGDIVTPLGYSAYDKEITIGLYGNYDIDEVIAFFNSEGTVVFSNEPDKYYYYQIYEQIDFERLVRFKTASVTLHVQPFKYSDTEGADILTASDNFATLNQTLNTDTSFYTYSSNTQDDVTATRNSGTGGKFFAVFTVPVVEGVTYYFSGDAPRGISMYGYTDNLRGTSAGISGLGFSGYYTYTATFTGTMVLGFYSSTTTEIFIRNFTINNEAGATVSGEGTELVLEGTILAPFSQFDLKGNTEQQNYTGKNLVNLTNMTASGVSSTNNDDGTVTIAGTATESSSVAIMNAARENEAGTYTLTISRALPFTIDLAYSRVSFRIAAGSTSVTATATSDFWSGKLWMVITEGTTYNETFGIQLTKGSTPDTSFEPYVGGVPSPNQDYPQDIKVVTGENVVKIDDGQGNEQSYPISLGSIELCKLGDYQDYIWKDGDEWKVHKAIGSYQFDGSEHYRQSGATTASIYVAGVLSGLGGLIQIPNKNPVKALLKATHFVFSLSGASAVGVIAVYNGTDYCDSVSFSFDRAEITDVTSVVTWIAEHQPKIYAPIFTPTDTTITDSTLIAQLNNLYNRAHAYQGRTHISSTYASGNVPHIIAASVIGSADGTVTNAGNIYSKPKLTIFGSGDIGVYLNGNQIFQVALGDLGNITIDVAEMEAYTGTTDNLQNRAVDGDYNNFTLAPGDNQISFSGSVTMCVVENYSRWL